MQRAIVIVLGLLALAIGGCSANSDDVESKDIARASAISPEQCMAGAEIQAASYESTDGYAIQPGDQLDISFYLSPEFDDSVTVRPDGKITMKLVGDVQAAGRTPDQLAAQIDKLYLRELRDPAASVHVKSMPGRQIYVEGAVAKPGAIALEPGMTALQAIADAGGLTSEANDTAILIRRDACGTPQQTKLNLKAAVQSPSLEQDAALMPRDIVVVPRSGIANVDLWFDQHVRKLIPVDYVPVM